MASGSTLKLPEEISIANVNEWKGKLVDFMSEPSPYTLDGSELQRLDTAAIQLLLAFTTKLGSKETNFSWQSPSPALLKTADLLGLKEALSIKN